MTTFIDPGAIMVIGSQDHLSLCPSHRLGEQVISLKYFSFPHFNAKYKKRDVRIMSSLSFLKGDHSISVSVANKS